MQQGFTQSVSLEKGEKKISIENQSCQVLSRLADVQKQNVAYRASFHENGL